MYKRLLGRFAASHPLLDFNSLSASKDRPVTA
jgi:hypothetical protein